MRKKEVRELRKKDHGVVDMLMILQHFFKDFRNWIQKMKDPRHQSYITYAQTDFVYLAMLKNLCSQHSMRQMEENFNEENCIAILRLLSGNEDLEEMPHYDTLNNYLERVSPEDVSELRRNMLKTLIRGKQFNRGRLVGKYWRVILDGTGLFCFKERHCEHCLSTTHKNDDGSVTKRYYHKVLEAKLVLSDKIVISLGTEFIENEEEGVGKQDCENKAAKRLMERIKQEYPRLPICIQGDGLYAVEPIMKICKNNGWVYLFTHKETVQKLVNESYEWEKQGLENAAIEGLCKEKGTGLFINHVEKTAGKEEIMNVYEYSYQDRDGKTIEFRWMSSIELTKRNLEEMILAGCGRWKIENEGFNNQKNGTYRIEHLNSRNTTAMKNHYLFTQIADILMQLYLAWNPYIRKTGQSIKNTSSWLLESFRRQPITSEDVSYILRYTTVYLE